MTTSTAVQTGERDAVLHRLETWLERPMLVLGLIWLLLLVLELTTDLPTWLQHVGTGIWAVFVADFAIRFWLAEHRLAYLRSNWLTVIALIVPALRVLRIAQLARFTRFGRAARGIRMARLATSLSRAKRSVHGVLAGRHAVGYVVALTTVIAVAGAAGMYSFERDETAGFESYGNALWWTAMLLTTIASDRWPSTPEGRILCVALSLYGLAIFGYITATIASWLLGRSRPLPQKPEIP